LPSSGDRLHARFGRAVVPAGEAVEGLRHALRQPVARADGHGLDVEDQRPAQHVGDRFVALAEDRADLGLAGLRRPDPSHAQLQRPLIELGAEHHLHDLTAGDRTPGLQRLGHVVPYLRRQHPLASHSVKSRKGRPWRVRPSCSPRTQAWAMNTRAGSATTSASDARASGAGAA
jgi:hypothetical protein